MICGLLFTAPNDDVEGLDYKIEPLRPEKTMHNLSLVLLSLAAILSIFFGVRYLLTREFMPYHAVVSGRSWAQLEPGVQTAILGMLRIVGGGLMTYGLGMLWLLLPLNRGEAWASWAILTITASTILPTLYVTIVLRRYEAKANTPIIPTVAVLVLVLFGVGARFVASG